MRNLPWDIFNAPQRANDGEMRHIPSTAKKYRRKKKKQWKKKEKNKKKNKKN